MNSVNPYQFIWSTGLGFVYAIHSILLYYLSRREDYRVLYAETLDWGNYPKMSLAVTFGVSMGVMPIAHLIQYLIYYSKMHFKPIDTGNITGNASNIHPVTSELSEIKIDCQEEENIQMK